MRRYIRFDIEIGRRSAIGALKWNAGERSLALIHLAHAPKCVEFTSAGVVNVVRDF